MKMTKPYSLRLGSQSGTLYSPYLWSTKTKTFNRRRFLMKCTLPFRFMTLAALALLLGCSERRTSADVKGNIEQALNEAGLKSVNVSQDRDKGVVTLTGDVLTEADKQRAEEIAKSMAHSSVVANEIGVRPSGFESEAKKVDSNLDAAIEKNLEAALIAKQLNHDIKYSAKNGVVTLSGDVNSIERRNELEQLAASVTNVKQVINELQVKEMKATSRK